MGFRYFGCSLSWGGGGFIFLLRLSLSGDLYLVVLLHLPAFTLHVCDLVLIVFVCVSFFVHSLCACLVVHVFGLLFGPGSASAFFFASSCLSCWAFMGGDGVTIFPALCVVQKFYIMFSIWLITFLSCYNFIGVC